MTGTAELTDFDLMVDSETWNPTPCESPTHSFGWWGHQPEAYAAYIAVPPCGMDWAVCAGWVEVALISGHYAGCDCGEYHSTDETRFIPFDNSSTAR